MSDSNQENVKSEPCLKKIFSITGLSVVAIIYFIFIIGFYIKSHPNPLALCGNIDYKAFSDFGTHVAGIAAIFAFILVFATYK